MYLGNAAIQAQTCTNPILAFLPTGDGCSYEVRLYQPPYDPLYRIRVTVQLSSNAQAISASLYSHMTGQGYELEINQNTKQIKFSKDPVMTIDNFTLPNYNNYVWLPLFQFSFAGTPNAAVTADFSGGMINLFGSGYPPCNPTFQNSVSCTLDETATISGQVTSPQFCGPNFSLAGVAINVFCTSNPLLQIPPIYTDANGMYSLEVLSGEDYYFSPAFNGTTPLCGGAVNSLDYNALYQHQFGTSQLTQAWQIMAADFNNNNSITYYDLLLLGQAINSGNVPANFASWQFVSTSNYFWPVNLSNFHPYRVLNNVSNGSTYNNQDFYGVKTGDIDGSCTCSMMNRTAPEDLPVAATTGLSAPRFSPNPFYNELTLDFQNETEGSGSLTFFTADGRMLLHLPIYVEKGFNEIFIDTGSLPAGVLLYKIVSPDGLFSGRLVKQN